MTISLLDEYFPFEWQVFGIVSSLKEYRLAWNINNLLKIQLKKQPDRTTNISKTKTIIMSYLTAKTPSGEIRLIANKTLNKSSQKQLKYVLPEFSNYDFILQKKGFEQSYIEHSIKELLLEIQNLQLITELAVDHLDSHYNLLFE